MSSTKVNHGNFYDILSQVSVIVSDNARSPMYPASATALKKRRKVSMPMQLSTRSTSSTWCCDNNVNQRPYRKRSIRKSRDCCTRNTPEQHTNDANSLLYRRSCSENDYFSEQSQGYKAPQYRLRIHISGKIWIQEAFKKDVPPKKPLRRLSIQA